MERHAAPSFLAIVLAIALAGCSTLHRMPADGLYVGELCTAVADGPLNCGAADALLSRHRAKVRASDFIYDLALEQQGQVEVMLVHGSTLVDVWSGPYSWDHHHLRFIDLERRTFYRVRFANPVQVEDVQRRGD